MSKYILIILTLCFLRVVPVAAQLEGGFQDADEANKFRAIDFNNQFISDAIEFEGKLLAFGKGTIYTYNPVDESIKVLIDGIKMDAGEVSSGEFIGIYSMLVNEKVFDVVVYNLYDKNRAVLGAGYAFLSDPVHNSFTNKGEILEFIPEGQGYYVEKIGQKTVLSTGGIGESNYSEVQEIFSFRKFKHGSISTNVLFFVDYKTSDLKTPILYKIAMGESPANASGVTELNSHDLSIFNDAAVFVSAAKDLTTRSGEKGETVKVIQAGLGMENLFTFGDNLFCAFIPADLQIYVYDPKFDLQNKVGDLGSDGKFLANGLNNVLNLTPNIVALETKNLEVLLFDSELNQLNINNIITSTLPLLNVDLVDKLAFLSTRSLTSPYSEEVSVVDVGNGVTELQFKLEIPLADYTVHNTYAKTTSGVYHASANKDNGFEVFIKNEKGFQVAEEIFNTDYEQAILEQLKIPEVLPEYSTYPKRILNLNGTIYSLSHLQMPGSYTNTAAQEAGFNTPVRDMNFLYKLNRRPGNPSPSSVSVDENAAVGTVLGAISATDQDDNNLSFQLVSGTGSTDNSKVALNGSQLSLAEVPDYEADTLWSIRVQVTDPHGDSRSRSIAININDTNEAPTGLSLTSNSVSENLSLGDPVAGIETVDEDEPENFTYSLAVSNTDPGVADADNGDFTISDSILVSNTAFDALVKNEYFITLEVSDKGGETYQQAFVISIIEENRVPINILLDNNTIEENLAGRTLVGTLDTEDLNTEQDNDDSDDIDFTYALISGTGDDNNSDFEISADSLYAISSFDFEENASLSVLVQTTDPEAATYSKAFTITVEDINDAPTGLSLTTEFVSENLSTGEEVAGIEAIDEDETDSFTYSLVSSNTDPGVADADNDAFSISGSALVSNTSFDRATKAEYFITLNVTDKGGESYQKAFVINITEVNEVPTDIILANSTIEENLTTRTLVGTLDTEDADTGEDNDDTDDVDFTYALVSGSGDDNNSDFEISADSLYAISTFDFEENASLSVRIQTTDPKNATFKKSFTITVSDTNDPPTSMVLSNDSIDENRSVGVLIGTLDGKDPDASDEFSFALIDEANFPDNSAFSVNSSNELVQEVENFDYESQSLYEIKLQLTDKGGESIDSVFIVHIRDTNDQPSDITLSGNSVTEETANAVAGSLGVVDQDANDTHDFSIPSDTLSNNLFQILTGNELALSDPLNYEANNLVYEVYLEVSDLAGTVFGKVFEINLIDINDPVDTLVIKRTTVKGGLAFEEKVSNIELRDEDLGDNIANFYSRDDYTLSLANLGEFPDNSNFQISYLTDDEVYALRAATDLTYTEGADNNYQINIEVVNEGLSYSQSFEISLVSESTNTPPTEINISNDSILSVATVGTEVGVLSSVDDTGDTHTYSLATNTFDNDNELFSISADRLILQANLQDSTLMSYTVVVISEDNGGSKLQEEITIYVKEFVDSTPPEITGVIGGDFSVDERQSTFDLSGTVVDDAFIESVQVQYGPVTSLEFTKNDIIELEGDQFTSSIPSNQGDAFGLKARVIALDTSGNTAASDTVYFYREINSSSALATLPGENIGKGKKSTDYRMFSVPYTIQSQNQSIRDIFETSLGETYSDGNFKVYHWNPEMESYEEFLSIGPVEQGEAYWFSTILEEPVINFGAGNVYPYKTNDKAVWNLKAGWNQIGNPYPVNINWDVIQSTYPVLGDLYAFGSEGYNTVSTLAPHQGAFVLVQENISVEADVTNNLGGREAVVASRTESALELAFKLRQGELQAVGGVGMHKDASDGLDGWDQANPPALGDHVEISFKQPESIWDNYRWDVVREKDYHVWSFKVNVRNKDQFSSLSWDASDFLKGQFYLIDMEGLQKIDLTEHSDYQFRGGNQHQFKLVYDRFSTGRFDLGTSMVGAPYPNPFKSDLFVPINISDQRDAEVTIEVMDLSGKLVAKKSWNRELKDGYQLLSFENTDNGTALSSGVYLYQLTITENSSTVEKMGRIIKH